MRTTRFYAVPYLTDRQQFTDWQPVMPARTDARANFLAGLMLFGLLSLSLLGLATLVALVGYSIHLMLA